MRDRSSFSAVKEQDPSRSQCSLGIADFIRLFAYSSTLRQEWSVSIAVSEDASRETAASGEPALRRSGLPVPRSVADAFVACVVLLEGTAAGLIGAGGRGRVGETLLVGAGCICAYLAGWRKGRWLALVVAGLFLVLEAHFGRLVRTHYWQDVFLAAGAGASALASAYLRLTVASGERRASDSFQRLLQTRAFDEIDEKLGIGDRHVRTLAYELERARRHNHVLTVLVIRPDEIDDIAVRFGDGAATQTLGCVAAAIGRSLRATDIPVRERPFDFAAILPETKREDARIVAERIRLAVSEQRLEFGPGDVVDPTVSIGVAAFPHDATSNEQMTAAVHRALAGAVQLGGNRTMLFSVPDEAPAGWGLSRELTAS